MSRNHRLHWRTASAIRTAIEEADEAIKDFNRRHPGYWLEEAMQAIYNEPLHLEHPAVVSPALKMTLDQWRAENTGEIEPRDPPHYFAGHPMETVILGTMLTILSLFTILWIVAQR